MHRTPRRVAIGLVIELCATLCMMIAAPVHAADDDDGGRAGSRADVVLSAMLASRPILISHPDLWYRSLGKRAYESKAPATAFPLFLRAAGFADKPSQAIIAVMYWSGDGVKRDRPRAYAWMDLAASRGYPEMVAQRELYWKELGPTERAEALEVGREIYAEYGDVVALKRLDGALVTAWRKGVLGSRTGFVGTGGTLLMPGNSGFAALQSNPYELMKQYEDGLWRAQDYARLKDIEWLGMDRYGRVTVGDLQQAPAVASPKDSPAPSGGK